MTQVVKIFTDALEDPKLKVAVGTFITVSTLYSIAVCSTFILLFVVTFLTINNSYFNYFFKYFLSISF